MKTLILIIILYFVINTIRAMSNRQMPRPGIPGSSTDQDESISGSWDLPGQQNDEPLSGPWSNRLPDNGSSDEEIAKANPPVERRLEIEPLSDDYKEKIEPIADQPAVQPQIEVGSKTFGEEENISVTERQICRRRQTRNPVAAALANQNTIAGSIILGEVLGSRGGRRRR